MSNSIQRTSYLIGRLDRTLTAALSERIAECGVTVGQYTALSILKSSPGLSNAQLARRTLVRPQSMIQVISSLEAAGLIRREQSSHHAKVLRAELTPAGRGVLRRCDRAVTELEEQMFAGLSDAERLLFHRQLSDIV